MCRLTRWNTPERVFIREQSKRSLQTGQTVAFLVVLSGREVDLYIIFSRNHCDVHNKCAPEKVLTCQEFSHEIVFSPDIFCQRRDVSVTLIKRMFYEADCAREATESSQNHSRGNK